MSQDSREQFEAHYDEWSDRPGFAKECRMGDTYTWPRMSQAWFHWQASREAVVVRIDLDEWPTSMAKEIKQAIEAAGVKVAP